jgi:hypothetical protein
MKSLIVGLLIFSFSRVYCLAEVKNESSITVTKSSESISPESQYYGFKCSGLLQESILKRVHLAPVDLKNGVDCAPGDFDGNGYLDFALFNFVKSNDSFEDPRT